jgi:hypothetical protein
MGMFSFRRPDSSSSCASFSSGISFRSAKNANKHIIILPPRRYFAAKALNKYFHTAMFLDINFRADLGKRCDENVTIANMAFVSAVQAHCCWRARRPQFRRFEQRWQFAFDGLRQKTH